MRTLTIISLISLTASIASAQEAAAEPSAAAYASPLSVGARSDDGGGAYRFGKAVQHHGFYAAPTFGVTALDGAVAPVVGMRAVWIADHTFGVGMAFNATSNQVDEELDYPGRVFGGYGGLLLQYIVGQDHAVHGSVDATLGGALVCRQTEESLEDGCDGAGFFMVEPMANIEFDLFKAMRLSLGAGYRLAAGDGQNGVTHKDASGVVGKAALEFGRF